MEMDRPPIRMQICLSPGRETENLFGVALYASFEFSFTDAGAILLYHILYSL